ncbi:similar to Saccharomyces cerevisiae YDL067C COX9 Subunit VIIa of cytochrome c oxidase, which is the terminal member of the mitochondrial inner membrane electron transport chain [Maudiozyma saulgeensis]|uniref:Cytochrome c oxidase subunit 9, mitochondrial n=1 Tax=Maudiozyma saulgeensis TaxID=1789683 RepID=A0A1X7QZR4_9SACH|nr:similar to Saccharomyces cerevisiae YDL067C COX9 Subunit VIIa of cytochrome c oxidase, which is the terminal member of the mitochondrial inner membrane electron transport chain [Kazachstania saulgeensis]
MSAITPITGTLRKRAVLDILVGFTIGGAMASYWWWGFHMNIINKREAFYAELAEKKRQEDV